MKLHAEPSAPPYWAVPGLAVLAVGFQLTVTLPVSEAGLRVSAADVIAPVLFLGALAHLWQGRAGWPDWRMRSVWIWLAALSAWLVVSLLRGYAFTGVWVEWAVINKFVGWFALVGFFLLGAWSRSVLPRTGYEVFLKAFLLGAWAIAGLFVALFIISKFGMDVYPFAAPPTARLKGTFSNPNAYGYFLALLIALQAPYLAAGKLFPHRVHQTGLAIAVLALLLTGSRSGWLGAAVALAGLVWFRAVDLRASLRGAAVALAATVAVYFGPASVESLSYYVTAYVDAVSERAVSDVGPDIPDAADAGNPTVEAIEKPRGPSLKDAYALRGNVYGLEERLASMRRAFALWAAHPVLGVGLGGYLWTEMQAGPDHLVLLHTTAQWLLTETGAVGLALFVAFFLACLWSAASARRDPADRTLPLAVTGVLLVFAGASLGMEAMYQRHLWFLLGLALAVPGRIRTESHGSG